jgi:hypothetical protein
VKILDGSFAPKDEVVVDVNKQGKFVFTQVWSGILYLTAGKRGKYKSRCSDRSGEVTSVLSDRCVGVWYWDRPRVRESHPRPVYRLCPPNLFA